MKRSTEKSIQISSIKRERSLVSKPEDFVIKFTPPLKLLDDMNHEIAMNKVNMTYSRHNISKFYKNNTIKYTPDSGSTWKKILFQDGNYSYDDLDAIIKETLDNNGDDPKKFEISFINMQYKVLIGLGKDYQLKLRGSKFGELIGFEEKIVKGEEIGSKLPNITNSIDVIYFNTDAVSETLVDGISSNTIAVIPTDNLRRSFPFTFHPPINWLFYPVSSYIIKSMRFYLRDALNRPIDLNGIDWYLELVLRSTPKNLMRQIYVFS